MYRKKKEEKREDTVRLIIPFTGEIEKAMAYEEFINKEMMPTNDESLLQNIFLFNITADPYERNDLSKVSE